MKALSIVAVVLSLVVAGCGNDSAPSQPAAPKFTSTLSPANETPAITNADASASGSATITLNTTKDAAGTITAATADFAVTMSGFPAGTTITAAHIHEGAAGVKGGVKVDTSLGSGEAVITNGAGAFSKNGINVAPDLATAILANPAGYYFNVHSALNAGGAIRGQLVRAN